MKIYHRQLNSFEELKSEKLLLKKQLKEFDDLSFTNFVEDGLNEITVFGEKGLLGIVTSFFNSKKNSLFDELIELLPFIMNTFKNNDAEKEISKEQIPDEVWDSFLKWKAMSWGITIIAGLFKKKNK